MLFLFIGLFYLVRAWLGYRRIAEDATQEYEFRRADKALPSHIDEDRFTRAYRRVFAPRKDLFMGIAVMAAAVLTIPGIALMEFIGELMWKMSGKPYETGPATLVWQFTLFFAIIAFWCLIFFLTARAYHSRRPGRLEDELMKEEA